ncbi:tRNA lysidine(34) synthetase TilS [Leptothrix discophora]|uniref:tRNA(Ile)-lysidine synthase n=1 Tax=Leptothrix discophora TaxID=89 RepID=A0ABT9G545_LEPDI|nr:tRNA lysidine(34) synthetase TilS [Leptothrix discophora]MDP4301618.1 tRNA lysidine(34) synthetase TilS [Leptothrix discophora]
MNPIHDPGRSSSAAPPVVRRDDLAALPMLAGHTRVAVAYSGGHDSTVLMHATCLWAAARGAQVHALHVQHGLSPHAAHWEAHCAAQVDGWTRIARVSLHIRRLALVVPPGASLEAHARAARYAALADMAREAGCDTVLLAHHLDDQVETFLLQALRGAGPAGLSAMPVDIRRDGLRWVRPWLDRPRVELAAHREAHGLSHIEDDSNADPRLARNRLRLLVLPALRAAFPQADETLSACVRQVQDARVCVDALARIDLEGLRDVDGGPALSVSQLLELAPARQRHALRRWLIERSGHAPSQALLMRLSTEVEHAPDGRWQGRGGLVHAHRGRLAWVAETGRCPAPPTCRVSLRPGRHPVPDWGGVLVIEPVLRGGISQVGGDMVELRPRQGGEQFQSHPQGVPRSLKKQFQDAGVPSWARAAPLVWRDGLLVQVEGLGVDARARVRDGEPQWSLRWEAGEQAVAGR